MSPSLNMMLTNMINNALKPDLVSIIALAWSKLIDFSMLSDHIMFCCINVICLQILYKAHLLMKATIKVPMLHKKFRVSYFTLQTPSPLKR